MASVIGFKLESEVLPKDRVEVSRIDGREAISQLFEFELLVVCNDPAGIDPDELVGEEAALVFTLDDQEVRRVYGMIVLVQDRYDTETLHSSYYVKLVPRAYRLTLCETQNVLLDVDLADIIREKLTGIGMKEKPAPAGLEEEPTHDAGAPAAKDEDAFDFELRLYGKYPKRELVVQYKETDLQFISRLCEHYGVSYFFEHTGGRDVIVFTDDSPGFRKIAGDSVVPFQRRGDGRDVFRIEETTRLIPSQFVVRDYNYRTPQIVLTGSAELPIGDGRVDEYGAHVKTQEEAEWIAQIRAEEKIAARRVLEGSSDVFSLRAGATFTLEGYPRGDLELLVTEVKHSAALVTLGTGTGKDPKYKNEFKSISRQRRFRPPRVTPKPRIHGVITGVIDASEKGQYAEVDDQGRYLVRFVFDTHTPGEQQASRWVRMAQPHAGAGYGMHFPLRPGVEVLLTFVDGDPDRPIIAATVPNPQTPSPVTAGNKPRNVIRTGAGNEINIDDSADQQRIKLMTPHKNTTFQLGYRNAPEDGVALETQGAYSSVVGSGVSCVTSFNSGLSAGTNLWSSMRISQTAEPPSVVEGLLAGVEVIKALTDAADSIVEMVEFEHKKEELKLKKESIEKQKAAIDAGNALKASRQESQDKLGEMEGMVETTPDLEKLKAEYEAAKSQYENDLLDYQTNVEWLTEAKKGEWVPTADTPTAPYAFDSAKQVETYTRDVEDSRKVVYGDPDGETTEAQKGSKVLYEEARQAYLDALKSAQPKAGVSQDQLNDAADAATDAFAAETQAETTALGTDGQGGLYKEADDAKNKYNTMVGVNELGDQAIKLKQAKTIIGHIKTAEAAFDTGRVLISEVMKVYNIAKEIWEHFKKTKDNTEASANTLMSYPRENIDIQQTYDPRLKWCQHTLGSKGDMTLYADESISMTGDKAVLFGKSRAIVQAADTLALLSKDKLEMASAQEAFVTSRQVDQRAYHKMVLKSEPEGLRTGLGTIDIESKARMRLESTANDIVMRAAKSGKKITMAAEAQIKGSAKDVKLDAVETASLLAGSWGMKLKSDAKGAGSLTVGNGGWELAIKAKDVKLGATGAGAQLQITDQKAQLMTTGELLLAGGPVTVIASTVDFGPAQIKSNNLMVKGELNAKFMQIKAKITAATQTANAAAALAKQTAEAQAKAQQANDKKPLDGALS